MWNSKLVNKIQFRKQEIKFQDYFFSDFLFSYFIPHILTYTLAFSQ